MAGKCKYCGFVGTNDEMMEHASNCEIMLQDHQPDDPKLIDKLYEFWFGGKFIFPRGMLITIIVLVVGAVSGNLAYAFKKPFLQILSFMLEIIFICLIGFFTVGLYSLKASQIKK